MLFRFNFKERAAPVFAKGTFLTVASLSVDNISRFTIINVV